MTAELPQLVFATRSATPRSGADFVRQIVAERGSVCAEARQELSLRADIVGSALEAERKSDDALEIFLFCQIAKHEGVPQWLFARASSLGLYRKGSHQLLVHGIVLDEAHLDALECNPFVLLSPAAAELGVRFLDEHPGDLEELPQLRLSSQLEGLARRHNRRRIDSSGKAWMASAYEALASGERVACVSPAPGRQPIEHLLLHFHPDDRREVSFCTFYSHRRALDYRLLGVLDADRRQVERQFRNVTTVDLTAPPRESLPLGERAIEVRANDPEAFHELIESVRLTHLSSRTVQPIRPRDAALALAIADPDPIALDAEHRGRLWFLRQRAFGGLAVRVLALVERLNDDPTQFEAALDASVTAGEPVGREDLLRYIDTLPEQTHNTTRWAILALLGRREFLEGSALSTSEHHAVARRLFDPPRFRRFVDELSSDEAASYSSLLAFWALRDADHGPLDSGGYWMPWLEGLASSSNRHVNSAVGKVEQALARRPAEAGVDVWRALGDFCEASSDPETTRRLRLEHELPLCVPSAGRALIAKEVRGILERGEQLCELATYLDRKHVAETLFGELRSVTRAGSSSVATAVRELLSHAPLLPAASAESFGKLLAHLLISSTSAESDVAELVDMASDLATKEGGSGRELAQRALAAAARVTRAERAIGAPRQSDTQTSARSFVRRAALLLGTRLHYGSLVDRDAPLIDLAVDARIAAAALDHEVGTRSAAFVQLEDRWLTVLGQLRQSPLAKSPPPEAMRWIHHLQDEIAAEPIDLRKDAKLGCFTKLCWSLWLQAAADGRSKTVLEAKLLWACSKTRAESEGVLTRFVGEARRLLRSGTTTSLDWHLHQVQETVPTHRRAEARALLEPMQLAVSQRLA